MQRRSRVPCYGRRPRLMTRLTLPWFGSTVPGLGISEITWSFLTTFEKARPILPTLQWRFKIASTATASGLFFTAGTRHRTGGAMCFTRTDELAVTGAAAVRAITTAALANSPNGDCLERRLMIP
jgi:hypothetical protein